jgi:transposase, IS30 family
LSESLKVEFFRLLDRGGTVRAAAAAVGVSADVGYRWCRRAGVSSPRGRPRIYTAEEKAEFFRLLQLRGNVSAVARELGFRRVTCYQWAHKAGIFTGTSAEARRQEYLRLRAGGVPRAEAARRVGVSKRSGQDWDKGIRQFAGGRVYPGGRVVRYGSAVAAAGTLTGMKPARRAYIHGEKADLELLERPINARFLSLAERERIHDLHRCGAGARAIARDLGRAPPGDQPGAGTQRLTPAGVSALCRAPVRCRPAAASQAAQAADRRAAARLCGRGPGPQVVS